MPRDHRPTRPARRPPLAQRSTRQRSAIARAIDGAGRPLAPGEVLALARRAIPSLSLATVYRTLRLLVDEGVVTPVGLPGHAPRYEPAQLDHHHHFHCDRCDRLFDVPGCPRGLARLLPRGFRLRAHEIVLLGTCASCARKAT